jgi:hypothetical protein
MRLKYLFFTLLFIIILPAYATSQVANSRENIALHKADSLANLGAFKDAGQELFRLGDWLAEQDSFAKAGVIFRKAGDYFSQKEDLFDLAHSSFDRAIFYFKKKQTVH